MGQGKSKRHTGDTIVSRNSDHVINLLVGRRYWTLLFTECHHSERNLI